MKNVLVIGIGAFQTMGLKFLKENGYRVIGIDGIPKPAGLPFCDSFHQIELNEIERILDVVKTEKISFAIGFECDPAVDAINAVNSFLGLPSLNATARKASMDKLLVRRIQKEIGIQCPDVFEVLSVEDLLKHVKGTSKWVLKPKASSGSRGVVMLSEGADLNVAFESSARFRKSTDEPLILEEFIEGNEIAIDGFSHAGTCNVLTISHKDRTDPPFLLDKGLLISGDISDPLAVEARRQLEMIFKFIQPDLSTPFHAEFLHNDKGVFLVEFSFRGAGFNVFSKLIPKVTGFDTLKFSLDQVQGKASWPTGFIPTNKMIYLGFFDGRSGRLKMIETPLSLATDPEVLECEIYVSTGDVTRDLKSGADRLGHIVLAGSNTEELKKKFFDYKESVKFIYE